MFSATRAAFEGFRLIGRKPGAVLFGWTLFYAVAYALLIGAVVVTLGATMLGQLLQEKDRLVDDPAEIAQFFSGLGLMGFILVGGLLLISAIQLAAVFRAVLRPQDRGFAYLKLGGDELRQLLLMIIMTVFFMVVIGGLVAGLTFGLMAAELEQAAVVPLGVLGGLVIAILTIVLCVRLSLAPAMTFAQRRIRFFGSWGLTRRRFWPLLGMYLLAFAFYMVLYLLTEVVVGLIGASAGFSFVAMLEGGAAPSLTNLGGPVILAGIGIVVAYLVSSAMQMAVMYAPQAAAYRDLMAERHPPLEPDPEAAAGPAPEPHPEPSVDPATAAAVAMAGAGAASVAAAHAEPEHAEPGHAESDHGAPESADAGHAEHGAHGEEPATAPAAEAHAAPEHHAAPEAEAPHHGEVPAPAPESHPAPGAEAHPAEHHAAPESEASPAHEAAPPAHAEPEAPAHAGHEGPHAEPDAHPAAPHDDHPQPPSPPKEH